MSLSLLRTSLTNEHVGHNLTLPLLHIIQMTVNIIVIFVVAVTINF